jgi:hypothetical protein
MERNSVRFAVMLLAFSVGITAAGIFYYQSKTAIPVVPEIEQYPEGNPGDGKTLEMVFVIDTTGSMGGLIEGAKQKIWGIINEVMQKQSQPRVKVGLVAFRDRGDAYVTKVTPLTEDLDAVYSELMDYNAAGGGDTPEAVASGLSDAVAKAGWTKSRQGLAQIIFLVGDAPPQTGGNEASVLEITASATARNMIVNTIQCGDSDQTRKVWQEIAQRGQGKYFAIAQDGGVETVRTPYDDRLAELGRQIGGTYTAYGSETMREASTEAVTSTESKMTANTNSSVRADRAMNKALNRDAYKGDLLQDIENGKTDLGKVKEDELPADLKAMPTPARAQEVEKRLGERKKVRVEILNLSKQRAEYLKEERNRSGKKAGFDAAVGDALGQQLTAKGID